MKTKKKHKNNAKIIQTMPISARGYAHVLNRPARPYISLSLYFHYSIPPERDYWYFSTFLYQKNEVLSLSEKKMKWSAHCTYLFSINIVVAKCIFPAATHLQK